VSISSAPRYYDGLVFIGTSGGEFGARGRVYALDAQTGNEVWRFYTIPAAGEIGSDTWPAGDAYLHGGGDVWQTPAIDPDLGLIYFSTGSPAPHFDGSARAGDNLFTDSIVALDYKTGQYRWHFQEVHHDIWDYGALSPVVLFDTVSGRRSLYQCSRTGWCYFLDRMNGQPLFGISEKPVPQESHQLTALTQPYPVGDATAAQCGEPIPGVSTGCLFDPFWDLQVTIRPGASGGGSWAPTAYDPRTNFVFVHSFNRNSAYSARPQAFTPGSRYESGSAVAPGGSAFAWTLSAVDASTNTIAWQHSGAGEAGYGALATGGGLVFAVQVDGQLIAYDARSGKQLWQFQTGWGITAPPISWSADGVQYITVLAGGNAESGPPSEDGDAVWTFALNGGIDESRAPPPPQSKVGVPPQEDHPAPFVPLSSAG
jgi:alcohol dehydrogenase (cytochrome c)